MAVLGGASAFVESTLAQIYKERDGDSYKGGPAYYIEKALHARWLGIIFAISLIMTFAFGFNGLQAYNIVSAFQYYVPDFEHSNIPLLLYIVVSVESKSQNIYSLFVLFSFTDHFAVKMRSYHCLPSETKLISKTYRPNHQKSVILTFQSSPHATFIP